MASGSLCGSYVVDSVHSVASLRADVHRCTLSLSGISAVFSGLLPPMLFCLDGLWVANYRNIQGSDRLSRERGIYRVNSPCQLAGPWECGTDSQPLVSVRAWRFTTLRGVCSLLDICGTFS